MTPRRVSFVLALAAVFAVAGCGGGASTSPTAAPASATPEASAAPAASSAAPEASATPEASAAASASAAPAGAGSMTVTLGSMKKVYTTVVCTTMSDGLYVLAGDQSSDGAAVVIPSGGSTPTLAGAIGGNPWLVSTDPVATLNGKQGTFSGTDAITQQKVAGSFSCP